MRRMGFPLKCINWICTLYAGPLASIRLNGLLSIPFLLQRGTRQGWPLSLAHFALAMELIAWALRISPEIHGVQVGWQEERAALYANDLFLFFEWRWCLFAGCPQNYKYFLNLFWWARGLDLPPPPLSCCSGLTILPTKGLWYSDIVRTLWDLTLNLC